MNKKANWTTWILHAARCFFIPVPADRCQACVRSLTRGDGWAPSMLLVALGGIVLPIHFCVGRLFNVAWIQHVSSLALLTCAFVAVCGQPFPNPSVEEHPSWRR